MKHLHVFPSFFLRRPIVLTATALCDPRHFPTHERVLHQRMTHSTTPASASSIMRERVIRGGKPDNGSYDALASHSRAPPFVFGVLPHESDGVAFPFSRYPRGTAPSSPVSILSLRVHSLFTDEYAAFYAGTTPSQFGERFMKVYRSVVVFARREHERAMDFCSNELVPLDKRRNRLVFADEANGVLCHFLSSPLVAKFSFVQHNYAPHKTIRVPSSHASSQ